MDHILHGLHFAYIDDVLIASANPDEHLTHQQQIFNRFVEFGIIINPAKCEFGVEQLQFRGHYVDKDGVRVI